MGSKDRPITDYFIFGRKKGDIALMIDFKLRRAIVRANTTFIDGGVELEKIPAGPSGYSAGMVLVKNGWRHQYFLMERDGWTDEQYFDHAEKLMGQLGIREP